MAATLRTVIGTLVHHINATDAGKGNSVAEVEGPLETVRKKATENVIDHFVSLGDEGGHDGDVTTTSSKSRHEDLDSIVGAPNEKGDNEGMQSAPLTRRRNSTFAVVKAAFKENAPSVHVQKKPFCADEVVFVKAKGCPLWPVQIMADTRNKFTRSAWEKQGKGGVSMYRVCFLGQPKLKPLWLKEDKLLNFEDNLAGIRLSAELKGDATSVELLRCIVEAVQVHETSRRLVISPDNNKAPEVVSLAGSPADADMEEQVDGLKCSVEMGTSIAESMKRNGRRAKYAPISAPETRKCRVRFRKRVSSYPH